MFHGVGIKNDPKLKIRPGTFEELPEDLQKMVLGIHGLEEHLTDIIKAIKSGVPLPPPSRFTWSHISRIMTPKTPVVDIIALPKCSNANEMIASMEKLCQNVSFKTEMEVSLRVSIMVLFAIDGLNLKLTLQPKVKDHPSFTDMLIYINNDDKFPIGFLEIKNTEVGLSLSSNVELDAGAQCYREAHILLSSRSDLERIQFWLTNGVFWCYAVVKKVEDSKIEVEELKYFINEQDWTTVIYHLRSKLESATTIAV